MSGPRCENWLKTKLELVIVIIGFLGVIAAGSAGWKDQQNKIAGLEDKVKTIDDEGSKVSRSHKTELALVNKDIAEIKNSQREMREENTAAHNEIKTALKDLRYR